MLTIYTVRAPRFRYDNAVSAMLGCSSFNCKHIVVEVLWSMSFISSVSFKSLLPVAERLRFLRELCEMLEQQPFVRRCF